MSGPACKGCGRFDPAGYRPGDCRLCWLWFTDPRYAARWGACPFGKSLKPKVKVKKSLPCVHVGERLTMKEIQASGLSERRIWHRCELGLAKNQLGVPGVACVCEGCGPKCEGYPRVEASE